MLSRHIWPSVVDTNIEIVIVSFHPYCHWDGGGGALGFYILF